MPREKIEVGPGGEPFHATVGWDHHGSVQVGVGGARMVVGGVEVESVWTHLDRRGCNQMIRTLRRARDAAFGRDE
jgi:hypothetical protein